MRYLLIYLCAYSLSFPSTELKRYAYDWQAMGTPWRLVLYSSSQSQADILFARVVRRVEAVEQRCSDYRPGSEVRQLSGKAAGVFHPVSAELYRILSASQQLSRRSAGAFDCTVGPLSKLWRRAIRQQQFPDSLSVRRARAQVQYRWITLADQQLKLERPGLRIDLGGIAKGYTLDAAAGVLLDGGVSQYLIDGGGDLLLGEAPPGAEGWSVQSPDGQHCLSRTAVAVSGSTYRYLEHEGVRYGHIIDPRTGLGVTHFTEVTVYGPRAMIADGLASAVQVLGREAGRKLLESYPAYRLGWREAIPSPP